VLNVYNLYVIIKIPSNFTFAMPLLWGMSDWECKWHFCWWLSKFLK